ncbi:MAG: hypothetical protein ACYSSI_07785 [Planctomycetota bacterium]|jgi:hypothetical protein
MKYNYDFKNRIWIVLGLGLIFATNFAGVSKGDSEKLVFSLPDVFGRKVHSQDYKGVPVFLEFGACW